MAHSLETSIAPRYKDFVAIGAGGMGTVFRAHDTRLDRTVAIKRIQTTNEEALEQLRQEAGVLATLNHPNILTILDVGHDEQGHYLVMEMLEGEDLSTMITRTPLSYEDFRELALQALEGLAAAHEKKILHRDIKPENIRVKRMPGGRLSVKLIDFGLARIVHAPRKQTTSLEGTITGTIFYMAPEQLRHQPMDQRMDLYALGCVFYQALCGVKPFEAPDVASLIQIICAHQVTLLHMRAPYLAPWLCAWVHQMMAFDPAFRHPDAGSAIQNFRWLERSVSSMSVPVPTFVPAAHPHVEIGAATSPVVCAEPVPVANLAEEACVAEVRPRSAASPSVTLAPRLKSKRAVLMAGLSAAVLLGGTLLLLPWKSQPPAVPTIEAVEKVEAPTAPAIAAVNAARLPNEEQLLARFLATSGIELGQDKSGKGPTNRVKTWTSLLQRGNETIQFQPSPQTTANLPALQQTRARGAFTWINFRPNLAKDQHSKCLTTQITWRPDMNHGQTGFTLVMVVIPGVVDQGIPILSLDCSFGQARLLVGKDGALRIQKGRGAGKQEIEITGLDLSKPCIATITYADKSGALSFRVRTHDGQRHTPAELNLGTKTMRRIILTLGNTEPPSVGQVAELAVFSSALDAIQCAVNENHLQEFYFGLKEK